MKKLLCCALFFVMLLTVSMGVFAASPGDMTKQYTLVSTETIRFDDGSSLTTAIYEAPAAKQNVRGASQKDGSKTVVYDTADGTAFEYTVYGTFQYDGRSAQAVDAWDSYDIYESGWRCSSHSATTSGASAKGSATFRKTNGTTKKLSATLTCSASGRLS